MRKMNDSLEDELAVFEKRTRVTIVYDELAAIDAVLDDVSWSALMGK
jgi:hypothetical protein